MIKITRPDGSVVTLDEHGFAQFYYADYKKSNSGTRIDGAMLQYTPETAESLAGRLRGKLKLIILTIPPAGPNRPAFPIWINVAKIGGLQRRGPNTSLIVTNAWFTVVEDYDTVTRLMREAAGPALAAESAGLEAAASDLFADEAAELKFDTPTTVPPVAKAPAKKRAAKKKAVKKKAAKKKTAKKTAAKKKTAKKGASKKRPAKPAKKRAARKAAQRKKALKTKKKSKSRARK